MQKKEKSFHLLLYPTLGMPWMDRMAVLTTGVVDGDFPDGKTTACFFSVDRNRWAILKQIVDLDADSILNQLAGSGWKCRYLSC